MTNPIGPLLAGDEGFTHQIADTFAVVATSDPSWTEKVCAMAAAKDGSLQLGFGLGKYTNRNVMDGYAGISRGVEQMTVRASRRLDSAPETTVIGPIRYEVDVPLRTVLFALEPNTTQPVSFEWCSRPSSRPSWRTAATRASGYRVNTDLVRYHQIGVARAGWRSTGSAPRSHPRPGCRPATTPGACATTSGSRPRTWSRRPPGRDVVPDDLESDRHGASRREPLRALPPLPDLPGTRLRPQARRHGWSGIPDGTSRALRRHRTPS
jgi:hypothetical protein